MHEDEAVEVVAEPAQTGQVPAQQKRRLKLRVAYDGAAYCGFQLQVGSKRKVDEQWQPTPTVQGELERVMSRIFGLKGEHQRVVVVGASRCVRPTYSAVAVSALIVQLRAQHEAMAAGNHRTDTGVHARGQACHLDVPETVAVVELEALLNKANMTLPTDIAIREIVFAPPGFNAKDSAKGKRYHFRISCGSWPDPLERHFRWWVARRWCVSNKGLPGPGQSCRLDVDAMNQAAELMVGRHDFNAFRDTNKSSMVVGNTHRVVTKLKVLVEDGDLDKLLLEVEGEGFLFHMVRIIAAALVEVGWGNLEPQTISKALETGDRALMPKPAPPEGLCLDEVAEALAIRKVAHLSNK